MKQDDTTGHSGPVPSEEAPAGLTAEALFRAHAPFVAAFVLRLGAAEESVDDLVQEVFLTAHRRGGYQPGAAKPTTWLAEIALRVVSNHRRALRRRKVVADEDALAAAMSASATPDDVVEQRDALTRVQ